MLLNSMGVVEELGCLKKPKEVGRRPGCVLRPAVEVGVRSDRNAEPEHVGILKMACPSGDVVTGA